MMLAMNAAASELVDDGSMKLCFDDAKSARNCLFFMPKFGNGIALQDASGESRAILYLDTNGVPHLLMRYDQGHPLVSLPQAPSGRCVKVTGVLLCAVWGGPLTVRKAGWAV